MTSRFLKALFVLVALLLVFSNTYKKRVRVDTSTVIEHERTPLSCPTLAIEKKRPLQFIHVPKAGGTSIQEVLKDFAKANNIPLTLHDGDGPFYDAPTATGIFVGHRGYGYSSRVSKRNPVTIVAVREPLSRIVSLFDYLVRTTETTPGVLLIQKAWRKQSLDEVIATYNKTRHGVPETALRPGGNAPLSARTFHRVLRSQVQFLCGYDCVWLMSGDSREITSSAKFPLTDQQVLQRALGNIEKVDCIATLNRLDDLILQMRMFVDFIPKSFVTFPHENKVDYEKSTLSQQSQGLLKQWLNDDFILYNKAVTLAEERTEKAKACVSDL